MSTSRAIKPKRDDTLLSNWESLPERAPSIMREDRPMVARVLAMIGLFFLVLGALAMLAPVMWPRRTTIITPSWGFFFSTFGLSFIFYHTFNERDFQFRRLYAFLGLALVGAGVILKFVAFKGQYQSYFILGGLPALVLGLVLLIAVIRNETDEHFRMLVTNIIGGVGALGIAFGMINGMRDMNYLPGEGALLMLLGLLYFSTYIGLQDPTTDRGYMSGLALGAIGLFGLSAGLIRSFMPASDFLIPAGLILMGISLIYVVIALGVCVDWPVLVLARRELAAYFYSPVAYLIFAGQLITIWFTFFLFIVQLEAIGPEGGMFEPIIGNYIFNIIPVIVQMFFVPALTMRLLSEEKRTGTLEVLFTAPVSEISVVFAKFLGCWVFYMLLWVPWWIFFIALRYFGGQEFDYYPILSFMVAMGAISAGFLAMGLFFSALTSNQIIAAVFTFVGMMTHLAFYMVKFSNFIRQGTALHETLTFVNYLDFWLDSLNGTLAPRFFVFHLSVAVFFLFATVKVLESRKWQ